MLEEILIAGFGGQGVMSMGQLLAYAGMYERKHVSWIPSYGPEMRGGTANCSVCISDKPINSPTVSEPTTLIVLNRPSLVKFEQTLQAGGLLILNTSLIDCQPYRQDVRIVRIPANDLANEELGNVKVANMILLGAYLGLTQVVKLDSIVTALKKVLPESRHRLIPLNQQALEMGLQQISREASGYCFQRR